MHVYDSRGRPVKIGERIGRGGEASVFRVTNRQDSLAKIYEPAPRPNYPAKLACMLSHPPESPTRGLEHERMAGHPPESPTPGPGHQRMAGHPPESPTRGPGHQRMAGHPPENPTRRLVYEWMAGHPPGNPTQAPGHASLAWPTGLLYDGRRRMVGYLMPNIRSAVPILDVFNPRRRQVILPQFNRRYLHRVARNLAAILNTLHAHGYMVGDLNESNVLVTPSALVTLIDTDSFQVQELRGDRNIVYPCPVGRLEYTPPELQGKNMEKALRQPEHDAFGLGVLIFQLLMEGSHPFRAQWLGGGEPPPLETRIAQGIFPYTSTPLKLVEPPQNAQDMNQLHPILAEMVRRCFVDGHQIPSRRPRPDQWEKAIAEAERALIACPGEHIYSSHLRACPICGRSRPASTLFRPAADRTTPMRPKPPSTQAMPMQAPISPVSAGGAAAPAIPGWPGWWNWSLPKFQAPAWLSAWSRSRLARSLMTGGMQGALAGAIPGALVSTAGWSLEHSAAWSLLFVLGGIAGGLLRGWRPGYRIGVWVDRRLGWSRFWQGVGLIGGAVTGALTGLVLGAALIFPIFIGMIAGARGGMLAGKRLWETGARYGWERIWAIVVAANAALLGAIIAWAASAGLPGLLGNRLALALAAWLVEQSTSPPVVWAAVGALGGAFGGYAAGFVVDLFGRMARLVD